MAMLGFSSFMEFVVYITFIFFGASILMTTNAIMSAPDFITKYYKFAQDSATVEPEDPVFWKHVLTYFNVIAFATQMISEVFILTPLGRSIPLRPRLIVGLFIPFAEIATLLTIPAIKTTETGAKITVFLVSFVSGLSKTLCESSTGALAGPFPTKFYSAVVWGLGASGIISSAISLIIKASMPDNFESAKEQSHIYFGVALAFQVVSCVLLVVMPYNPFAREYTAEFRHMHNAQKKRGPTDDEPVSGENNVFSTKYPVKYEGPDADSTSPGNLLDFAKDADDMKDIDQVENITSTQQMLNAKILTVFRRIWPMLLSCFVVFLATLLLFPGVFFAVSTSHTWYATLIIAMFNLGDFLSRSALLLKRLQPSPRVVLAGSFLRLLIVPPLVLCVRGIIPGVALPYILCLIWGLTNGYFGGAAMIYCTRSPLLATAGQRSIAAIQASFSLLLGLFAGSSLALGVLEGLPRGG